MASLVSFWAPKHFRWFTSSILLTTHAIKSNFHTLFGNEKNHYRCDQRTVSLILSYTHFFASCILYKYLLSHIAIVLLFSKNNLLIHNLLLIPSSKHCTKSGVAQEVRLILFLEEGTGRSSWTILYKIQAKIRKAADLISHQTYHINLHGCFPNSSHLHMPADSFWAAVPQNSLVEERFISELPGHGALQAALW